ncbi:MAG: outer membrane biogenesis protein BamB [Lentisphaerae bacterium ADurb.Bin242]|nr:MAG: outer membrane biogenesis protein BamB [Lentisphaerae bacterium ADurb.Bin242]
MKKILLFSGLFMMFFYSAVWAEEYRITCKVTAPETKNVLLCDGEKFYPVAADGSCNFTVTTDCEPFVYILFPDNMQTAGKSSFALTPGENRIAFQLEKRKSVPAKFTFIHGSDIQYDFLKKKDELANDMAEIRDVMKEYDCAFITFPGDLSEFGEPAQLEKLREEMERAAFPRYPIWGGHDGLKSEPKLKNFTKCFGAPYYSWNYGGIHFMAPVSEYRLLSRMEQERQFKWMDADFKLLPPGTPVMLVTHDPPRIGEYIEKRIRENNLRLLGYLGAHYHYDNIFYSNKILSLYNAPLRAHDTGTFTKKLRLIECSAKDGILSTRSRYLNQRKRIHSILWGKQNLIAFVYDTVHEAKRVVCLDGNGLRTELKRTGDFVWTAELPGDRAYTGKPLTFEVDAGQGSWSKQIVPSHAPELLWCHATGNTFFRYPTPSVRGDRLFLGLSAENPDGVSGGVLCLDRQTGKQLWRTLRGVNISAGVVSDGISVYALTNDGELLTLDAKDGKLLRRQNLEIPGVKESPASWRQAQSPLCLAEGKLLVHYFHNRGGYLHCIDPATGKALWKKPAFLGPGQMAHGFSAKHGRLFFSGTDCYGVLDLNNGSDIWRTQENIKSSAGVPLITDSAVYYYLRSSLRKVDPATGKVFWKLGVPGSINSIGGIVPADGKLIAFSTNAIISIEEETGKRLNRVNLEPLPASSGVKFQFLANTSAPVTVNGKVIVAGDDGTVYRVDPATAQPSRILSAGSAFKGAPAVVQDMVYLVGYEGNVYAIQIK